MKILTLLMVFVMLLSIPSVSAKEVINKELKESEYGTLGHWFGIGDRLYKITYSDGTVYNKLVRTGEGLEPGYISYKPTRIDVPVGGDPSGIISIPISLEGISCSVTGSGTNRHTIDFYYSPGGSTPQQFIAQAVWNTPCNSITPRFGVTIPNNYFGTILNTPGEYYIIIKETAYIDNTPYGGENTAIWLKVLTLSTPVPTPSPVTTLGSGLCKDSYGNVYSCGTSIPSITSTPTPSMGNGYIKVNSNIGGVVYIDGINKGASGNIFTVDVGRHEVTVQASGYSIFASSVVVDYGATVIVEAILTKEEPAKPYQCSNGQWISDLSLCPTPTPTSIPTPIPTSQYRCSNGQWVSDTSLCPTSTPSQTTPQQTSGMTLETPSTTRTPSPVQTPYDTPGFEAWFAVAGLIIVAWLVLRQKPPKTNGMDVAVVKF